MSEAKDYTGRAAVRQYGPYWRAFAKERGVETAIKYLNNGWTNRLKLKDRRGLIQMLQTVGV
jgi:hypothetical protein